MLLAGLLEKLFHIFTYCTFSLRQITLRELIFVGTNFCEDSDFKYFAETKFHEFLELRVSQQFLRELIFAELSKTHEVRENYFP